jgi:hypothetical protein
MSRVEIKDFLEKNLAAKKPFYTIKSELMEKGVLENEIESVFLETLKVFYFLFLQIFFLHYNI